MTGLTMLCVLLALAAGSGWGILVYSRKYQETPPPEQKVATDAIKYMQAATVSALASLPAQVKPTAAALRKSNLNIPAPTLAPPLRVEPAKEPELPAPTPAPAPPPPPATPLYRPDLPSHPVFIDINDARLRPWYIPAPLYKPSSLTKTKRGA